MNVPGLLIDVTRPYEEQALCPECGRVLSLPEDWQRIMREGMDQLAAMNWDGKIRCKGYPRGHRDTEMIVTEATNTHFEPDGSVIIHLVSERNPRLTACTNEPYAINNAQIPYGTVMRQCQACYNLVMHGGYKEP